MTNGAALFSRFAYPPNSLGYCGPADTALLGELVSDGAAPDDEFRHAIAAFAGAWPYLALIGNCTGRDPLDPAVVEAYWIGNALVEGIDLLTWGNSLDERFRARAGLEWDRIEAAVNLGGVPNHAFHVFCAYPWVGLLRTGAVDQARLVLDRCRIRWGRVVGGVDDRLLVEGRPLQWDGRRLYLGGPQIELVRRPVDPAPPVGPGDVVALHWDYVCQPITPLQLAQLRRQHDRHLSIANGHTAALPRRLDG